LESDITLYIEQHESELAMKVNCAAYDGDSHRVKRLIRAGADPTKTDYNGRSPLVWNLEGYGYVLIFLIIEHLNIILTFLIILTTLIIEH
jgi:hypothetical protein